MVTVCSVAPHSPASKAGLCSGDVIISVNGHEISDVLDYDFHTAEKKLTLSVHRGAELLTVKLQKGEYDRLGCEFETYLMDKKQTCRNKCVFCFIDQNPKGMRESIYFKDDDSRMSFLAGNYVTLTNFTEHDMSRIIEMHISPINISVHTTNPELRVKMMNNKHAGECLSYIARLAQAGIWMNMQIVLCPDINDGEELTRTLRDLACYVPAVRSIAVVPVGLTKYRDGLYPLRCFTSEEAKSVVKTVTDFSENCLKKYDTRLCYASDEFYLVSGEPLPTDGFYEDYPQIDNGVGMIRSFLTEVEDAVCDEQDGQIIPKPFSIATGYAAYDTLDRAIGIICDKCFGGKRDFVKLYKIKNEFFGDTVTVAGLVTGGDIITALSGEKLGERLYIPKVMLRYEQDRFLDDVSLDTLKEKLGIDVEVCDTDGISFAGLFLNNK